MANVLVNEDSLSGIANAIRTKNGTQETYLPSAMPQAILDIQTKEDLSTELNAQDQKLQELQNIVENATQPLLQDKTVTTNGVVTADEGYYGLGEVTVNVSTSEDLTTELNAQDEEIARLKAIIDSKANPSAKPNIFMQLAEPETKKGLWLQKEGEFDEVAFDDDIFIEGEWEDYDKYNSYNVSRIAWSVSDGTYIYLGGVYSYNSSSSSGATIKRYDPIADTYTILYSNNSPASLERSCATIVGNIIYIFGGGSNGSATSTVRKFDLSNNSLDVMPNMPLTIANGSAVATNDYIYVYGSSTNKVLRYSFSANSWAQLNKAFTAPVGMRAIKIGNYIYCLSDTTLQRYDYSTGEYITLSNVPTNMTGCGITAIGDEIYLLLGTTNYKYNILSDTYTQLEVTLSSQTIITCAIVNNKIYGYSKTGDYYLKPKVLPLSTKVYNDKTVVINQGKYNDSFYDTELFTTPKINSNYPAKYSLIDAWYYTTTNSLETNIPTYYGDGTSWIKIKN